MSAFEGFNGPYTAPVQTDVRSVPNDWIDYNGHMNVSYYSMAFDQALDDIFENVLGIGVSHTERTQQGPYVLQNNLHYLDEFREAETFSIVFRLIDYDQKRIHAFMEMLNATGDVAATSEQMLMNVDLTTRRSTPYADWVMSRLATMQAAHEKLPKPRQLGAPIGIRRKG